MPKDSPTTEVQGWEKDSTQENLDLIREDKGRNVTLRHAGGSADVDLLSLKDASFANLLDTFGVVSAEQDEALGSDQFGPIMEDKSKLIGTPFLLLHWQFNRGDAGEFVTMFIVTPDNARFIVNDGSTGIRDQLLSLSGNKGLNGGVFCKHGLRKSEYDKVLDNGQTVHGITYYIDTKL